MTPPASVRNPLALWLGSWLFKLKPTCTTPNPSKIKPMARIREKIKVDSIDTIVTTHGDKPYYENKYREVGDKCYHIGYSSYRLDVALEYREKYFELVERENDWIPVSERLPKKPEIDGDSDDYIVQTRRVAQPFIGYWDGREWTDEEVDILDEVIAWMPLPEPYKEVEDGN